MKLCAPANGTYSTSDVHLAAVVVTPELSDRDFQAQVTGLMSKYRANDGKRLARGPIPACVPNARARTHTHTRAQASPVTPRRAGRGSGLAATTGCPRATAASC
jgi:hypothetical protein